MSRIPSRSEGDVELVSVAAIDDNLLIGNGTRVPWDIPKDIELYYERVKSDPVILGRRTFQWLADDPPGAMQIVLTRSDRVSDQTRMSYVHSVDDAIEAVREYGSGVGYVLGGEAIYELFQPHVDRMVLSRVPGEYMGDAYYPDWDRNQWQVRDRTEYDGFIIEEWVRPNG